MLCFIYVLCTGEVRNKAFSVQKKNKKSPRHFMTTDYEQTKANAIFIK